MGEEGEGEKREEEERILRKGLVELWDFLKRKRVLEVHVGRSDM